MRDAEIEDRRVLGFNGSGVEFMRIPGYPHYAAGSDGRIWEVSSRGSLVEVPLEKYKAPRGVVYRATIFDVKGVRARPFVHNLVLRAFSEREGRTHYVEHINGDTLDNRVENLRWMSFESRRGKRARVQTPARGGSGEDTASLDDLALSIALAIRDVLKDFKVERRRGGGER